MTNTTKPQNPDQRIDHAAHRLVAGCNGEIIPFKKNDFVVLGGRIAYSEKTINPEKLWRHRLDQFANGIT